MDSNPRFLATPFALPGDDMIGSPLWLALGLLTTLPVPVVAAPNEREIGVSVLLYPFVGAVIGLMLCGLALVSHPWPGPLSAMLVLFLWLAITGGLHLEGLGDLADAWVGGIGRPERMLEIMKDPRCGPAAVMAITMQLLFKFSAIQALLQLNIPILLFFSPVLGRAVMLALMLSTPYLRPEGMASVLTRVVPREIGWFIIVMTGGLVMFMAKPLLLLALGMTVAFFVVFRWMMLGRLGGITGDVLGAVCELSETVFLLSALLFASINSGG